MSMLIGPKAIIPGWGVVLGVVALFGWPMTWATGALLIFVGVVPLAIWFILSREPSLTVAEVLYHAETSQT